MAKKKIMIVDDEPDTVVLAKAILEMNHFETMEFNVPEDALASIEKGARPDLIILDMTIN